MDDEDLGPLDGWARLGAHELARICKVSLRTAHHWISTDRMPERARQWLRLTHYGELGAISKTWGGWKLYLSGLCSPSGLCFKPSDIEIIPNLHAEHHLQRIELLQLRAREQRWMKALRAESAPPMATPSHAIASAEALPISIHGPSPHQP